MESGESAERAKEELNNYTIFEDGSKLNVFFSNLETISFQNSNSGGVGKLKKYKKGGFLMGNEQKYSQNRNAGFLRRGGKI